MTDSGQKRVLGDIFGRFWYVPDIIVIVLLFLCGAFVYSLPIFEYRAGRHNDGSWAMGAGIALLKWLLVALVCLLIMGYRMAISWPKHIPNGKTRWSLCAAVFVGFVVSLVSFFTPIAPPGYKGFIRGFREYARANVDVSAIRGWLGTLDPNVWDGDMVFIDHTNPSEQANWPESITSLHPNYIELRRDSRNRQVLRIVWLAFDADWGVAIGSVDMEIPQTQPRQRRKEGRSVLWDPGEYRLPLVPGVYVWHGIPH